MMDAAVRYRPSQYCPSQYRTSNRDGPLVWGSLTVIGSLNCVTIRVQQDALDRTVDVQGLRRGLVSQFSDKFFGQVDILQSFLNCTGVHGDGSSLSVRIDVVARQ